MRKLAPTSRYNYSVLYRSSKGDFWGTRPRINLKQHDTDTFHRVGDLDSHRIDLIAWKYYRNTHLWWVIAEVNKIGNPREIPVGTVLRIPSYDRIMLQVVM